MAKEKSADPEKEARRAAKAERKAKRAETDGVHKSKSSKSEKSEKTEKIEKKIKAAAAENTEVTTKLLNTLEDANPGSVAIKEDGDLQVKVKSAPMIGALVPFANPLADEKVGKKVLKSVKKAAKKKCLKRGVKEVVKALRKSSTPGVSGNGDGGAPSIVILAADISPMDVISHIPVLCEDHGVPYIFVTSRAELGSAGNTKRPTSVVMVGKEPEGKKKAEVEKEAKEGDEDFSEVYKDLLKVVTKAGRDVRV